MLRLDVIPVAADHEGKAEGLMESWQSTMSWQHFESVMEIVEKSNRNANDKPSNQP